MAVPAVLSIASIRIYKVKEKPTDGLLPRERVCCPNIPTGLLLKNSLPQMKLFRFIFTLWLCFFCQFNIYTPLPQSAQDQVVPEQPGIIQSGVTTARESIQPFVQASKVFTTTLLPHSWSVLPDKVCSHIVSNTYTLLKQLFQGLNVHVCAAVPALICFPVVCGYCAVQSSVLQNRSCRELLHYSLKVGGATGSRWTCMSHAAEKCDSLAAWKISEEDLTLTRYVWRLLYSCCCVGALL